MQPHDRPLVHAVAGDALQVRRLWTRLVSGGVGGFASSPLSWPSRMAILAGRGGLVSLL